MNFLNRLTFWHFVAIAALLVASSKIAGAGTCAKPLLCGPGTTLTIMPPTPPTTIKAPIIIESDSADLQIVGGSFVLDADGTIHVTLGADGRATLQGGSAFTVHAPRAEKARTR